MLQNLISRFAYQTAMGIGDAVPAIALSVVGTPAAGAAYIGLQTMQNAAYDAKLRGASDLQAVATGTAAGVVNGVLSYLPMKNLSSYSGFLSGTGKAAGTEAAETAARITAKGWAEKLLGTVFVNASQAAVSQAASEIVDTAIMGNLSHYAVAVKNNMAQGISEKDARARAFGDIWSRIGTSAGTGVVEGLVMHGIGVGADAVRLGAGRVTGKLSAKMTATETNTLLDKVADGVHDRLAGVEAKAVPKTDVPEEILVNKVLPKAVSGDPINLNELINTKPLDIRENNGTIRNTEFNKKSSAETVEDNSDILVDTYKNMRANPEVTGQVHHLNQDAVFRDMIPKNDGLCIELEGNVFIDAGSPHNKAHSSLESFWSNYRKGGSSYREIPTLSEYNTALYDSLKAAGLTDSQTKKAVQNAMDQQHEYGFFKDSYVPRIPGRINYAR